MDIKKINIGLGAIFLVGIILRFLVFEVNNCYIHDDAALANNIIGKSYIDFFIRGLDNCQVAPPLFACLSKFIYGFMPKDYHVTDLCLKIIPFISGLISIPLFYILSKLIFQEKFKLYVANLLFALNPLLICLSGRFKQYSTELVVAIFLYIIFYKYLSDGKWKKYWYFVVFLAPWFSLSSLIVLFSAFLIILFKNRIKDLKLLFFIGFSIAFFAVVYLPDNMHQNYEFMNGFWVNYGFMSIVHPQRFLIRLGELFLHEHKYIKTFLGFWVLYKMFECIIKNRQSYNVIFITVPILVTVIMSSLHLYPFNDRLIAFLVPLFIIIMTECSDTIISKAISVNFILVSVITMVVSVSNVYKLPDYRYNPAQYLDNDKIHRDYIPFKPVYKWYTHLE